jgi:hypothetical protein
MQFLSQVLTALAIESLMTTTVVQPTDVSPTITVGTQEVGLSAGYILPHRFMTDHTTKQQGPVFMPSWMMTLTDPIGDSWYRGKFHSVPRWSISSFKILLPRVVEVSLRKLNIPFRCSPTRYRSALFSMMLSKSAALSYIVFGLSGLLALVCPPRVIGWTKLPR